jgi:glycosyltransferase involved in cell wall biosynthesis
VNAFSGVRGDAAGLRLALFSGNYNYTRDGANQALNRLVGYLEAAGAAVRVYSPTARQAAFAHEGELVSVPSLAVPGRAEYRVALGMPRRVRRDVLAFGPTAVHVSAPDLLGLAALRLARGMGVPVVASLHTRFETYLDYYGLGWLRPAAERYLAGFYGGCACALAPNRPLADLLAAQAPKTRVALWSRGVDRQQFAPACRSADWRRAVGLAGDEVAVLFLGRLVREKGLDILVDTFAALGCDAPVRPVIVGDGPARGWLRSRLPGAVFTGFLSGEALGQAVASCDLLFNPSRTEAFGNVTLEAMAASLPVVCPEAPSTRELVTSGQDGVLVRAPAPEAYAQAIRALAADPEARRRLGAAARRASERYDWAASCDAVLGVYRELGAVRPIEPTPAVAPARRAARAV